MNHLRRLRLAKGLPSLEPEDVSAKPSPYPAKGDSVYRRLAGGEPDRGNCALMPGGRSSARSEWVVTAPGGVELVE